MLCNLFTKDGMSLSEHRDSIENVENLRLEIVLDMERFKGGANINAKFSYRKNSDCDR